MCQLAHWRDMSLCGRQHSGNIGHGTQTMGDTEWCVSHSGTSPILPDAAAGRGGMQCCDAIGTEGEGPSISKGSSWAYDDRQERVLRTNCGCQHLSSAGSSNSLRIMPRDSRAHHCTSCLGVNMSMELIQSPGDFVLGKGRTEKSGKAIARMLGWLQCSTVPESEEREMKGETNEGSVGALCSSESPERHQEMKMVRDRHELCPYV